MKNILLPTDFSVNSLNAIDYAMHFFEGHSCHFFIINIQKTSEYISDDLMAGSKTDSIYDSIATDNKKLVRQLVKKLSKQHKSQDYVFHGLFDFDDLVSAIDQAVTFHDIDLIVMGTNGATGAKEVIFGSNTLRVIQHIDCPTLTIPENHTFTEIKNALFSTQQCEDLSFERVDIFKEILQLHQSYLHVIELDDDPIADLNKKNDPCLQKLFAAYPYDYYRIQGTPGIIAVNTATQLLDVDMHAVFAVEESFLERLFFGSQNSSVLYHTRVPMLFLHQRAIQSH